MSNVVHVNFSRWGILQSDYAQLKPFQIMDRAVETMTPAVRDLLSITPNPEQAWCSIIFDCAVNSGMFIRMIKGDDIVIDMGGDGDDVVIPLGNVFAAAGQVMEGGSIDWQVWIWDAAEEALEKAAKSMMS